MTKTNAIRWLTRTLAAMFLLIQTTAWAADLHCDVCRMMIPEKSRSHFVLKAEKPQHLCSLGCLRQARRKDAKSPVEVASFNDPAQFIPADQANYLVGTKKLKADLGDMVMPPFFAAFKTRKEADAQRAKYGEGEIVQGFEKALK